jgi:hypothetical protein
MRHGHERTRRIAIRVSEHDLKRLEERASHAGAKTVSAYLRAAGLCREVRIPAFETLRDLRNEVMELTLAIRAAGSAKAMEAAIRALDRISRL